MVVYCIPSPKGIGMIHNMKSLKINCSGFSGIKHPMYTADTTYYIFHLIGAYNMENNTFCFDKNEMDL